MLEENTPSTVLSQLVGAAPAKVTASSLSAAVATRVRLTDQQLESASREDLIAHWKQQDAFIDTLLTQATSHEDQPDHDVSVNQQLQARLRSWSCLFEGTEIVSLRDAEEKSRQQHSDLLSREKILVRRLAAKEQEMQEYAGQLSELKAREAPGVSALRSAVLDPAVNLLLLKLRQELAAARTRVEETQNELSAWKFTPDSNTGKRLMAKCRLLYQENEELGRVIASGRVAKLEGELALQKSFSEEVKKSQSELDEFLQDLDEDVEGMQSTIYYLQQELRKAKDSIASYEQEKKCNVVESGGGTTNGVPVCNGDSSSNDSIIDKVSDSEKIEASPHITRKRTSSEDSDDLPLIKKVRRDSELSIHYSDEEVGLTNGESSTK